MAEQQDNPHNTLIGETETAGADFEFAAVDGTALAPVVDPDLVNPPEQDEQEEQN